MYFCFGHGGAEKMEAPHTRIHTRAEYVPTFFFCVCTQRKCIKLKRLFSQIRFKPLFLAGPAVLSTAVIARSSSAPRLQTYKAEDDISVGGTFVFIAILLH